jgi:hypothetical protein
MKSIYVFGCAMPDGHTYAATVTHYGGAGTSQLQTKIVMQYFISLLILYKRYYSPFQLKQTMAIMKGIVFSRLLRDKVRHFLSSNDRQREKIASDITAWRQILTYRVRNQLMPNPSNYSSLNGHLPGLRRLDWRFLLPSSEGKFRHLVLLGGTSTWLSVSLTPKLRSM